MSFTEMTEATARLNRSELAVPGSNRRFLEKAAQSAADVVFLDLEDSVSPSFKDEARQNVIEALNDLDWGEKTVSLRLNGLDTAWTYRDVVDVLEKTGERLDLMMLPKVGVAADVYALDVLVSQVERARGRQKRIGFELIIESAMGPMPMPLPGPARAMKACISGWPILPLRCMPIPPRSAAPIRAMRC